MIGVIEPWIVSVDFMLLLAMLVIVLKELHDIYVQAARIAAAIDKLHLMIWGALGTPETSTPTERGDSAAGRFYAPDGWGEEEPFEDGE